MAALGVPTAIVGLIFVQLFSPTGCFTQFGQKFILAMPNSTVAGSELNIVLINPGTADLTVTSIRTSTSVTDSHTITARNSTSVQLTGTADYLLPANSISNRTLVLSAAAPFGVLVYGTRAQDGYMALPVEAWGRRHVVGTFCQGDGRMCEVVVIASQQNTQVTIRFPVENLVFQSADISPVERTPIVRVLGANQTLVVQRPFELSGTVIESDADVGVLAGAQWTSYEGAEGSVIEQLPPVTALGTDYVTLPDGTVRVVAVEPLTTIHFPDRKSITLTSASHCFQLKVATPTRLRADRPILVLQFGKLGAKPPAVNNFPFLVVLTTRRQFVNSSESIIVPSLLPTFTSTLFLVTRQSYMEDIVYDNVTLNQTVQDRTSSSQFVYPDYAVVKRNVDSTSILSGQRDMAAYLQLQGADGVVLSPLAAGFSIINTLKDCSSTTPSEAGDTVDNDCDGEVDEDDCSGTSTGTDCKLTISGGRRDVWGTQFVFVIPMHLFYGDPSKVNITVAVTTLGTAQVDLHEPNRSVSTINVSLYNSSYFIINPDNSSALSGDMSMSVYRLNSSAEVSATFFFNGRSLSTKATGGAMRLIPVDAFGREYYIFTPKIQGLYGYFQLVGVFPNTTVEIYLVLDPRNITVTFGGVVYRNYDVIYTRVNAYQALQISCYKACTMSGSLVSASKPVAVFSMTDFVKLAASTKSPLDDHLMEQLPPVLSYGNLFVTTYGFKSNPSDLISLDVLYVIASQPNTAVHFENGSVTDFTLNRAGDVQELFFNGTTVVRTSDPVLCIHVLLNLVSADAAMLVVAAENQFTNEDIFRTIPVMFPTNTINSIHLVVHSFDALSQEVTINNETYLSRLISYSDNISVVVVHVSYVQGNFSQSLHVVPKRGTFGGYMLTYCVPQQMVDISGLAFILEQNSSTCNVSTPQPGDGVDNDCDGVIDEEPCLISFWNDTDSDGRYNEDCMPEVSTVSSMIDSTNAPTSSPEASCPRTLGSLTSLSHTPILSQTTSESSLFHAISFEALGTISPTSLLEDALSIYSTEGLSTGIEITPVSASLTLLSAALSLSGESVGLLTQDSMRSSLQIGKTVSSYSYVSTATTTNFVEPTSADDITTESTFSTTTISSSTYVSTATMTSSVEMTSSDDTSTASTFSATTMPSYSYDSTVTMTSSVSDVIVASTISPTETFPSTYISAITTTSSEVMSSQDIATQSAFSPTTVLPSSTRTTGFGSTSTPVTSSSITPQVAAPASSLCPCTCPAWVHATRVDAASLASMTDSIVRELTVNKSEISAVRRKKISVPDKRQSAQTFGYFGIVVIVATCVSIVLLDSGSLARDLRTLIANCSSREARS